MSKASVIKRLKKLAVIGLSSALVITLIVVILTNTFDNVSTLFRRYYFEMVGLILGIVVVAIFKLIELWNIKRKDNE